MTEPAATKKVRIRLSALTRLEYSEVLEVPSTITDAELQDLVEDRYDTVDGGDYYPDPDYWRRGNDCYWEPADAGATVTGIVTMADDGFTVEDPR